MLRLEHHYYSHETTRRAMSGARDVLASATNPSAAAGHCSTGRLTATDCPTGEPLLCRPIGTAARSARTSSGVPASTHDIAQNSAASKRITPDEAGRADLFFRNKALTRHMTALTSMSAPVCEIYWMTLACPAAYSGSSARSYNLSSGKRLALTSKCSDQSSRGDERTRPTTLHLAPHSRRRAALARRRFFAFDHAAAPLSGGRGGFVRSSTKPLAKSHC